MNNYNINNLINQQKLNEINANETKLAQEKVLEKEIFDSSPILENSPRPVEFYEEKGNSARKSLFFINEENKKFVYLTRKEFFTIDPEPSRNFASTNSYRTYQKEKEFRERVNKNEKVLEKIEKICVKSFVRNLEKKYLVEKLCEKIDYQSGNTKEFKELKIDDPQTFFENLFEYIEKFDDAKDILIIAGRKTYRFVKQNEKGKFLESYIGNLLEADLKNGIKLIITSQKGLLIPYLVEHSNYDNTHYLEIHYEIDLIDNNPIVIFKEENKDKSYIS